MTAPTHILVHNPGQRRRRGSRLVPSLFTKRTPQVTVGLWDLGAWLGGINSRLVTEFNTAQSTFEFFEVLAAVPVGLTSSSERVSEWFTDDVVQQLTQEDKESIADNVIANEFFTVAEAVRQDLGLDYLVGITPAMVAGVDNDSGDMYWNHFSTFEDKIILASTYDLRDFAHRAGVRFELFIAGIIVAQTLVAKFYPELDFHNDRNCLFDYREDRASLAEGAARIAIERSCLMAISPTFRPAAQSLLDVIHRLGGSR